MKSLKSWFVKQSPPERRSAERVASPWLVAYAWNGSATKRHSIRDISSGGVYLLTDERWQPGELVSISLHKKDLPEENPGPGIPVQVRAIRSGGDGVGFSFVQARDLDLHIGEGQHPDGVDPKEPEAVRRKLHMAKASAFVDQICPSISEEVKVLFRDRLSTFRVGNAIEIALKAEHKLKKESGGDKMRAHPRLVMRVLEDGSWADDHSIQEFWAGLLVASCSDEGEDESNLEFVRLLSDIASEHVQIFATACARAHVVATDGTSLSCEPVVFTMEELVKITGLHDLNRIDVDIDHLTVFGLFEKRVKSSSYTSITDAVIRPSRLGLELYARCHGHRGAPQDFYATVCR
jgi:PilZ domain-containing protein